MFAGGLAAALLAAQPVAPPLPDAGGIPIAPLSEGPDLPDAGSCLKCHLEFRDGWVADLSKWPEVKR